MTRLRSVSSLLLAAVTTIATALPGVAQDPAGDAEARRKQPKAKALQERIDDAFGTAIGVVTYYPFMNIADWFGLDTRPRLRLAANGEPQAGATVLPGHQGPVTGAFFSPNSEVVVTLGADKTARIFNMRGEARGSFEHPADIKTVAFFPEGGEFTTACADGTLRVFGIKKVKENGQERDVWAPVLQIEGAHAGGATRVGYSKNGSWLWSFGADNTVRIWNDLGKPQHKIETTGLRQLTICVDNNKVQMEEIVYLIDGSGNLQTHKVNGTPVGSLEGKDIQGLQALRDGSVALAATGPKQFLVIDRSCKVTGEINLAAERTATASAITSAEGKVTISITDDSSTVTRYETNGTELGAEKTTPSGYALEASASPDAVALRSIETGKVWVLQGHSDRILAQSLAPDGTRALTCSADGTARIWDWYVRGPDGKPVATSIPLVVLWLVIAAVIFTIYMRFVNLRLFRHAVQVVRGKFSDPEDEGEVSHFQALSSALSATVGLGNIAGVAIAVSVGGPGATFWMIVAGLLGMTLKFTECTLGQMFRKIDPSGSVSGGPMHYLKDGLKERGLIWLGYPLSVIFTVFCIGGSLAGGNAFQVNQSADILKGQVPFFAENGWAYGVIMAFMVGVVIIGGIRRIAQTAEKIVPTMCGVYVLAALTILVMNYQHIPGALGTILGSALSGDAIYGGALGALIMGFRRAAFSNEAGVGSASIAHSAARTPYAVREGIVALLEPFIDTVVVCTMTALVIVITGVYNNPQFADMIAGNQGAGLTAEAFKSSEVLASWFPWVLMAAVVLFAFSTMISWSYYGERCWTNLFGPNSSLSYKVLFLLFTVLGSIVTAKNVLEFGDVMILLMAFPNILGLYFLGGLVKRDLLDYERKLANGEIQAYE